MPNVILRELIVSDLPIIFKQMSDPESSALAAVPSRNKEEFDVHWTKIMADDTVILQTIEVDGRVAGHLVSFLIEEERQVGYWLGKEYWGKGIATKALEEFLKVVQPRPLFGRMARHNGASKRVLEKCGFKVIGEDKYVNPAKEEVEEFILELDDWVE